MEIWVVIKVRNGFVGIVINKFIISMFVMFDGYI